jgi:large subunit ribosomal protein L31
LSQHPELHVVDAVCATCGTTSTVRSTARSLSIDVCSHCHPAYTGSKRVVARGDRIQSFNRRRALAAA